MSRFSKFLAFAIMAFAALACTTGAKLEGVLADAPASSEVVVKKLNINQYEILDTVAVDAAGKFSCKISVEKGQPEFVYVFYKDRKIASLLLEAGDRVSVSADTLGHFELSGSEESVKLAAVEQDYAAALAKLSNLSAQYDAAKKTETAALAAEMRKIYIDYYRDRVKYVMQNSRSLTVVPVLYQNFGAELPVFGQNTDAIHFMNTADSLETVYPESKYVKALRKEAEKRFGYLELESRLKNAPQLGFPEVELPDIKAAKIKLSEIDSKVVMLYFWNPSNVQQTMFNLDFLKELYEDFHGRGLEIYQAALTPDKAAWAQIVKSQNLPWINVCDGLGGNSPYIATYNLSALPAIYIISEGTLVDGGAITEKSLRTLLGKLLK